MDNQILPVLDIAILKEKANEFAMKGALESIKDFYTGYSSPFKKLINEQLEKTEISNGIALPDIISLINTSLSNEIDLIANTAIAQTFVPLVQRFLVREEKNIKFSDVLKAFINESNKKNEEDFTIEITDSKHQWLDVVLTNEEKSYALTLHQNWDSRNEPVKTYSFLSLPWDDSKYGEKMELFMKGGITLKMPFIKDILRDEFTSYIARLVIGKCIITMDCRDFHEDMFPGDECHCD